MHILLTKKVSFIGICSTFFGFVHRSLGDSFSFFSIWQCPRLKEKCQYLSFVMNMSRDAICVMSGANTRHYGVFVEYIGIVDGRVYLIESAAKTKTRRRHLGLVWNLSKFQWCNKYLRIKLQAC